MNNRIELINEIIRIKKFKSYLEIGVFGGECLFNINVLNKVAVDPLFGFGLKTRIKYLFKNRNHRIKYFELPSNMFFEKNRVSFDLIFIDGLHTWQQLCLDIKNSINFLSPNGLILIHDSLPKSKWEALPAKSYEDFLRLKPQNESTLWCGDGWKVLFEIKKQIKNLDLKVVNIDHGIGVILNGFNKGQHFSDLSTEKTDNYIFENDFQDYLEIIEIINTETLFDILKKS